MAWRAYKLKIQVKKLQPQARTMLKPKDYNQTQTTMDYWRHLTIEVFREEEMLLQEVVLLSTNM